MICTGSTCCHKLSLEHAEAAGIASVRRGVRILISASNDSPRPGLHNARASALFLPALKPLRGSLSCSSRSTAARPHDICRCYRRSCPSAGTPHPCRPFVSLGKHRLFNLPGPPSADLPGGFPAPMMSLAHRFPRASSNHTGRLGILQVQIAC